MFPPGTHLKITPCLSFWKQNVIFPQLFENKKVVLLIFEIQFPMSFVFMLVQGNRKMKSGHKK